MSGGPEDTVRVSRETLRRFAMVVSGVVVSMHKHRTPPEADNIRTMIAALRTSTDLHTVLRVTWPEPGSLGADLDHVREVLALGAEKPVPDVSVLWGDRGPAKS